MTWKYRPAATVTVSIAGRFQVWKVRKLTTPEIHLFITIM